MISVVIPHYNSSELLKTTLEKVLNSAALEGIQIEIVVVDDGSSESHRSRIGELALQKLKVVLGARNMGRSGAVNLGVSESKHDLILILDCDCHPGPSEFFASHLQAIADADVSLGGLLKLNDDFWGKYQDLAVERRTRQFNAGAPYFFTTQNVLIRKHVFQSVGGYDETYKHYGFEDRDLLIRLQEAGARFAHSPGSSVIHCDTLISLASIAKKMREAGQHTSGIFSTRHPKAYQSLGYSKIDARHHPSVNLLGRANADRLASRIDPWLDRMPFALGVALTRVVTALAYLRGTADAVSTREPRPPEFLN